MGTTAQQPNDSAIEPSLSDSEEGSEINRDKVFHVLEGVIERLAHQRAG
jgi:hypothetical protein